MSTKIYTVTAYRWGESESHSYVVTSTLDKAVAIQAAEIEEGFRGGKYKCEVLEIVEGEEKWIGNCTIIRER